jgi:pyruvate formate lyase activating enzyme
VVTNGFISREPLEALLPLIDAMNIDLKGFTHGFYKSLGGSLDEVKSSIELARSRCHVEITTLIIPGENEDDIEPIARWLALIDREIPLHLSRFFPRYRYSDRQATPRETALRLAEVAGRHLNHVFVGNM